MLACPRTFGFGSYHQGYPGSIEGAQCSHESSKLLALPSAPGMGPADKAALDIDQAEDHRQVTNGTNVAIGKVYYSIASHS